MDMLDNPRKGIVFVIAGVLVFSLQDVIIKTVSGRYPVHEIVFVRGLVAAPVLLLIVYREGGLASLRTRRMGLQLLRGAAFFAAYTCFYLGIAALPLAEAVTLANSAPLFVTALSVPILGERVEPRIWIAVCTGFAGVVVVMQPGAGIVDPAALLPVLAALLYAGGSLVTRRLGRTDTGSSIAFYTTVFGLVAGATIGLTIGDGRFATGQHSSLEFLARPWAVPSWSDLGLIALCGVIAAAGFYCLSQAYRVTRPAIVAPFEYTSVPLGILWGHLFWSEVPQAHMVLGMILILGSGIYVLRRSRAEGPQRP
jgi:drug/metabolite transporter (DMT)-like permease